MNIYKLSSSELIKLQSDFNKTPYGRRFCTFTFIPFIFGFLILFLTILIGIFEDFIGIEMINIYLVSTVLFVISIFVTFILFSLYQIELRKYCENNKNK